MVTSGTSVGSSLHAPTIPSTIASKKQFLHLLKNAQAKALESAPEPAKATTQNLAERTYQQWAKDHAALQRVVNKAFRMDFEKPEQLLKFQYQAGNLMLQEQFYAKTIELLAGGTKTLTQMPV